MKSLIAGLILMSIGVPVALAQQSDGTVSPATQYSDDAIIIYSEYNNTPPTLPYPDLPIPRETQIGSGVLVSPNGYVLTARHVVKLVDTSLTHLAVHIGTRASTAYFAQLLGCADTPGIDPAKYPDLQTDICVLKINDETAKNLNLTHFPCILSRKPQLHENLWLMGWPGDERFPLDEPGAAPVSSSAASVGDLYSIDKAEYHGTSGGPAFDSKGNLVGLITEGVDGTRTFITSFENQAAFLRRYGSPVCGAIAASDSRQVQISLDIEISSHLTTHNAVSTYKPASSSDFQLYYQLPGLKPQVALLSPVTTAPFVVPLEVPHIRTTFTFWAKPTAADYLADPIDVTVNSAGQPINADQILIADRSLYIDERTNSANRDQNLLKSTLQAIDVRCFGDAPTSLRAACRDKNSALLAQNKDLISSIITDRERASAAQLVVVDRASIVTSAATFQHYIGQPCAAWRIVSAYLDETWFSRAKAFPPPILVNDAAVYLPACADDSPAVDLPPLIGAFSDLIATHDPLFFNKFSPQIVGNYMSLLGRLGGPGHIGSIIVSNIVHDENLMSSWHTLVTFAARNCGFRAEGLSVSRQFDAMVRLDDTGRCSTFRAIRR